MEYDFSIPAGILQEFYRQGFAVEPTIEEQAQAIALPEGSSEDAYEAWYRPLDFSPPWLSEWLGNATRNNSWFNWNHHHMFGPDGRNIGYAKPGRVQEKLGPEWSKGTPQLSNYRFPVSLIDDAAAGYEHGRYSLPFNNCQDALENIVRRAREQVRRERLILLVPGLEPYIMR
ncbi:MAG: hypothetical protein II737_04975 [Mailhella sp.]|nr:hypothetical protein [Mailhella sp.]